MKKIALIKLGAKGDVIRTLPILPLIKKKYPESEIYWITKPNISDLIINELIEKTLTTNDEINEEFDILFNLDFDKEATDLANSIRAKEKLGFTRDGDYPSAYNFSAEYYINTIFDDDMKVSNRKTYQEMMAEAIELEYSKELVKLEFDDEQKEFADNFKKDNNITNEKIIGIHMGSGPRWPSKAWDKDRVKEFIKQIRTQEHKIILFAGPDDIKQHEELSKELEKEGIDFLKNNPYNSNKEFASLISICDRVVCSDSFALHVAMHLGIKTVALFFCTAPYEIEKYDLSTIIISPKLYDFFPERMDQYDKELTQSISVNEVIQALNL